MQVYDDYWQKIQELFAKERQWMTTQMQGHIREVNYMFADERKSVNVTRNMMVAISRYCANNPQSIYGVLALIVTSALFFLSIGQMVFLSSEEQFYRVL